MKKFTVVLCVFFASCLAVYAETAAEGTGRFALLIGNARYQAPLNVLQTPARDTEALAALLADLGYQVMVRLDADLAAMTQAIDVFTALLSGNPGNEGFFWFAGQGAEINAEQYLLPVDIHLNTDIAAASYTTGTLLYRLNEAKNKVNVVMLDTCFTRVSSGELHRGLEADVVLRQPGSGGVETMSGDIFYMQSAWAGQLALDSVGGGRNSPFTAAFLEVAGKDEPLALLAADIIRETVIKSLGRQKPYCLSYLLHNKHYTLYRGITR
jgi:uncharacterized caspase-like protein